MVRFFGPAGQGVMEWLGAGEKGTPEERLEELRARKAALQGVPMATPVGVGERIGAETWAHVAGIDREIAQLEAQIEGREMAGTAVPSGLRAQLAAPPPPQQQGPAALYPIPVPSSTTRTATSYTPGSPHALQWGAEQAAIAEKRKRALVGEPVTPREESIGDALLEALGPTGVPRAVRASLGKETEEEKADALERRANVLEGQAGDAFWSGKEEKLREKVSDLRQKAKNIRREQELKSLHEKGTMGQQLAAVKKKEWKYEDEIALLGKEVAELTAASKGEKERLASYSKQLGDIDKKIAEAKIDPRRYIKNMPTFAKVLFIVSSALGGGAEGLSMGRIKNRSFDLLNGAIDRDMAAQKANLEKLMAQRNYTASERTFVYSKWRDLERDKRVAALRASQMGLAKVGLASEVAEIKSETAKQILKLDAGISNIMFEAKEKARPKVSSVTAVTKGIQWIKPIVAKKDKEAAGKKPPPNEALKDWREKIAAMTGLQTTKREIEKLKDYGQAERFWPNTEAKRVKDLYLRPLAVSLRKARGETGVMTEQDFQRYKNIVDPWFVSKAELLRRIAKLEIDSYKGAASTIRSYRDYSNTEPWRKQLLEMLPPGPVGKKYKKQK